MSKFFRFAQTIVPIAGSIGYLYYLQVNDKLNLNLPSISSQQTDLAEKTIEQIQVYPKHIIETNFAHILRKFGSMSQLSLYIRQKDAARIFADYMNTNVTNTKVNYFSITTWTCLFKA